ncbi:SIS domain-containing protein [Microbacterium sp. zg-Y818]|uniref:SIS domain-containing protein n=1 Tax=unclassified Microbacterium TaxID=2609290 RepID=UPI00214B1FDE|nr:MULTISPECIES: SIS domain-containing protein [unclassified Microbacterium]MCR2800229.1 SIS domain-containing protein [Microbacterium sp. zg.Y818]WIM22196.1 SIS domain-containing protein [Microbacterium sp. zg-Y818]
MTDHATGLLRPTRTYLDTTEELLRAATEAGATSVELAGRMVAECFDRGGMLYVFGSGHSHVFAEEAFYRAGGAARVCPILKPEHMLHAGARRSTELERQPGLAVALLEPYAINPATDVLLVVSNSGANALPVEVAETACERGIPVIAITSVAYAKASPSPGGRLHEIADVVLDNQCPPGDALVTLGDDLPRVGPASTVVGLALLNAVIVEALARQTAQGHRPDIYLSAGMPGAREHNARTSQLFSRRNPHI